MIQLYSSVIAGRIDTVTHQFQYDSESVPMQIFEVNKWSLFAFPPFVEEIHHFSLLLQQISHLLFVSLVPEAKEIASAEFVHLHWSLSVEVFHTDSWT